MATLFIFPFSEIKISEIDTNLCIIINARYVVQQLRNVKPLNRLFAGFCMVNRRSLVSPLLLVYLKRVLPENLFTKLLK